MTVFLSPRQGAFFLPLCGRNTIHATCRLLQVYPALLVPGSRCLPLRGFSLLVQ